MPVIPSKEINFLQFNDLKSTVDFLELDNAIPKNTCHWQTNSSISLSQRYSKFLEDLQNESENKCESSENLNEIENAL